MSQEESIKQELEKKFRQLENKVMIQRTRRLFVDVAYPDFIGVFEYAVRTMHFSHLLTITGFDEQDKLGLMYHLAADSGVILNIKTAVAKDEPVQTVIGIFPGAEIYERELIDLLGAKVVGLPPGNRYPLTDDWPAGEYPLRKDWKQKG